MKNFLQRHRYDVAAWFLIVAASLFIGLTYTTYRINLFNVLFSHNDVREAILVDGRIPKTISLGKIDPLNPFIYEPPSVKSVGNRDWLPVLPQFPLTEEQKTVVNWYESWGGIREHFIAPALYITGKLLIKSIRHLRM